MEFGDLIYWEAAFCLFHRYHCSDEINDKCMLCHIVMRIAGLLDNTGISISVERSGILLTLSAKETDC